MPRELFNNGELKIFVMGIERIIEDFEAISKDQSIPFTPEARKDMKDILTASYSAKKKLEMVINKGVAFKMEEYREGDEDEFLTKQS